MTNKRYLCELGVYIGEVHRLCMQDLLGSVHTIQTIESISQ